MFLSYAFIIILPLYLSRLVALCHDTVLHHDKVLSFVTPCCVNATSQVKRYLIKIWKEKKK